MKGSIEKWPSKSRMPKSANLNEQEKENVSPQAAGGSRAQLPQIQNVGVNPFTDGEGGSSTSSTRLTLMPSSAGKRNSAQCSEHPNKKRSEAIKAHSDRDDCNESFTSTGTIDDHTGDISMDSTVAILSVAEPPRIDPNSIVKCKFLLNGSKDCVFPKVFYQYQIDGAELINGNHRMTLSNVGQFLAVNYIVDLTKDDVPEVLESVYQNVKKLFLVEVHDIDEAKIKQACFDVELDIATTTRPFDKQLIPDQDKIGRFLRELYSSLAASLLDNMSKNEAVYSLSIIKKFWEYQFPESNQYALSWGDETQEPGSVMRRGKGKGRRLDAAVKESDTRRTLCHIEIKRPNVLYQHEKYLNNFQKLAMMCKDTIDEAAKSGCKMRKCSAAQYYGNHMFVYTMTWDSGVYFWSLLGQSVIPFDRSCLSTVYPVLRLLHSLKIFLKSIETSVGDPQAFPNEEFPDSLHSPSKKKPSKRAPRSQFIFNPLEEELN